MTEEEKLYPFQEIGAAWLAPKRFALLADEMGLGKTVQVLEALDQVKAKKVLIVCPSVARVNWIRHQDEWSDVERKFKITYELKESISLDESLICSFDYVAENFESLNLCHEWDAIIVDEAHFLKSVDAKRAKAIIGKTGLIRHSKRMWLLSGTPAPNHAGELWIILYTSGQTKLKYDEFVAYFCTTKKTHFGVKITGTNEERIPELRKLLEPIMLRRLKKDVLKDLPPITYSHKYLEPGLVDFEVMPTFTKYFLPTDRRDELMKKISDEEAMLSTVMKGMKPDNTNALNMLTSIADSVSTLRRYIGLQKVDHAVAAVKHALLSKAFEKVVVFAIHQDVIECLRIGLKEFGAVSLYGGTPAHKKQLVIDKFTNNPKCQVFIGQVLSAGTAITLTAAHNVIFVEQDWVPGNNAQAVMRVHRIGQENSVAVRFYALKDSLDERIMLLLKQKTRQLTQIFDY